MNIWPFVLIINKRLKNEQIFIRWVTTQRGKLYQNTFTTDLSSTAG